MNRTFDPKIVEEALELYPFGNVGLDANKWLADLDNIAFADARGNIGLLGWFTPGVYTGHYFFKDRGKTARDLAVKMLGEIFKSHGAKIVRGLTPTEHKAAVWMTRNLGFKDYGEVDTWLGPCIIFMITKDEFMARHEGNVNG